ncbi:ABC transporter ATP-binding protein, partial [Mycobacterium tuberculosis]|nr:ABC transporter ATP-binding protein [Mycobacterium tuberculosis]
MAELSLRNVIKRFGSYEIIRNASLDVADGEVVVFVGPSGCGKSTLLRMIAGLEHITDGEIHIGDTLVNDVEPADRGIAMVFQSYALFPHMTLRQNVEYPLRMAGVDKAERSRR